MDERMKDGQKLTYSLNPLSLLPAGIHLVPRRHLTESRQGVKQEQSSSCIITDGQIVRMNCMF
jgi:hypothetical protein